MTEPRRDSTGEQPAEAETRLGDRFDIGPYHVLSIIGAGGMGRVFRARDSKLNRDVALKLVSNEFADDPDRLARFTREAQVLAALNHPNIAAIYGLEESGGRQALVLELVEGPTLADRIANGPLSIQETLSVARQIADALNAAHTKGIIHRDLKPANIKVTAAGVVKVLDFGLAKTAAPDFEATDFSQSPTMLRATRVGAVLGTAPYMSPEQARGMAVDTRTDIWAFGCVLFEMLTGRPAFGSHSAADSITRIIEREPDWTTLPQTTPAQIRDLLRHCLQKNRDGRLSSIGRARAIIDQAAAKRVIFSWRMAATLAVVAVVTAAAGFYAWRIANRKPAASPSEWIQITRLDAATQPALSPDGRMLAFLRGPSTFIGTAQLYVKLLPDGEPIQLTRDDLPKMSPAFSPDGSRIAYTVNDGSSWDTWEVPALRGEPRRWLRNASGLTWIGTNDLLYSEIKSPGIHMAVVRSSEARNHAADVYIPPPENGMAHRSYVSPDRSRILVVEMGERGGWMECRLMTIDGGAERVVGPGKARCTNAAWAPDGRWMYFSADAGDGFHLWRQRFPDGTPEQLTSGATEEEGIALAPDGKSLITSVGVTQRSVWIHDTSGDHQISLEGYAFSPLLSADEQNICYRVTRGEASAQSPSELWVTEIRSGQSRRLFPGQLVVNYDLAQNDRVVAEVREESGRNTLWLAWLDGREPAHPIPRAEGDNPKFGPSGEILFRAPEGTTAYVYRMNQDGTNRQRLFQTGGVVFGSVSPDGQWLSAISADSSSVALSSTNRQIRILPYSSSSRVRWTLDGKRVYVSIQYGNASAFAVGKTFVIPRAPNSVLPAVPPDGFHNEAEIAALPKVESMPYGDVALASTPGVYAYSKVTTTRNLYRIPLH